MLRDNKIKVPHAGKLLGPHLGSIQNIKEFSEFGQVLVFSKSLGPIPLTIHPLVIIDGQKDFLFLKWTLFDFL